jgi:hypothetical protein
MKTSRKLQILAVALLILAVVLDLIDQFKANNGIHFRLLHASVILLLILLSFSLSKKPN